MSSYEDIEVFDGKKLSDVLKDIYTNSTEKRDQIEKLVNLAQPFITSIEDATMLMPIIKDFMDVSVKNDKQLVDLGNLAQKLMMLSARGNPDGSSLGLTDEEKKQLEKIARDLEIQNNTVDEEVDELTKKINGL